MAIERAETESVPSVAAPEPAGPTPRLFTVDEYYKMAEVGILRPDERVQLIEGKIIEMPAIGPRHAFNVTRLTGLLFVRLGERALVRAQNPIRLANGAEPDPDVAAISPHPNPKEFETRHPEASESLLIVEVADTTLAFDLGEKALMYAAHGVSELWVVDLQGHEVVVHREPSADGYASVRRLPRGEAIRPLAFPDVTFTVDEILG